MVSVTTPKKNLGGVVTTFDPKKANAIILAIAAGRSLFSICQELNLPHVTFLMWVVYNRDGLADKYARACEARASVMAEEILQIADDAQNDTITRERRDGTEYVQENREWTSRARLRVETRMFLMERMDRRRFGPTLAQQQLAASAASADQALNVVLHLFRNSPATLKQADGEAVTVPATPENENRIADPNPAVAG